MTKRDYRRKRRVAPIGEAGVAAMRKIVEQNQYAKINEVCVDAFSASAFVQVYDALNPTNQAKLASLCVGEAMDLVWTLLKRREGAA